MRGALPAVTDGSGETITSERKRERGLTTSVLLQFKDTLVTPRPVEAQSSEGGREAEDEDEDTDIEATTQE